jgi:hypothetical protein
VGPRAGLDAVTRRQIPFSFRELNPSRPARSLPIIITELPWLLWKRKHYEGVSKSFRTESITKYTLTTINTPWEATQRVMVAKLTRLTHKIAIQLHLVAECCNICISRSRRPVRKLSDTPSNIKRKTPLCYRRLEALFLHPRNRKLRQPNVKILVNQKFSWFSWGRGDINVFTRNYRRRKWSKTNL